jgi:hypothetical protein
LILVCLDKVIIYIIWNIGFKAIRIMVNSWSIFGTIIENCIYTRVIIIFYYLNIIIVITYIIISNIYSTSILELLRTRNWLFIWLTYRIIYTNDILIILNNTATTTYPTTYLSWRLCYWSITITYIQRLNNSSNCLLRRRWLLQLISSAHT